MRTVTINLSDELERQLSDLSAREHRSTEETVREILRRRLAMDRFRELCQESEAYAKAAGFDSEDDVLRRIS